MAGPDRPSDGLLEIGRIARSHGLGGEVVVDLVSDRPERAEVGAEHITDQGELTVTEARRHQNRWIFRYAGCHSREEADSLRGLVLWGHPIDDEVTLWVHELVGCTVLDADDVRRGTVVSVVANPAADLLELDSGALVPINFVVEGPSPVSEDDSDARLLRVEVPEGLWDL